jgi:hypothetical protein
MHIYVFILILYKSTLKHLLFSNRFGIEPNDIGAWRIRLRWMNVLHKKYSTFPNGHTRLHVLSASEKKLCDVIHAHVYDM